MHLENDGKAVGIEKLTEAFRAFSSETTRLEAAYLALQKQFKKVNTQLEESNKRLALKVRELDHTTSYLNSIINHLSQGLLFVNFDGQLITYSPAAERILGIGAEQALSCPFWSHFADNIFGFSLTEVLRTRHACERTYSSIELSSGDRRELEVFSTVISDQSVQTGLIILIRDITEMRRLQVQAERHDRMEELGEMAAFVAHEIRNPLGGIEGFAALLSRDLAHVPSAQRMAEHIVSGARVVNRLVTHVLDYARPVHINARRTAMGQLGSSVLELLAADPLYKDKQVKLHCPEPIYAYVDSDLFKMALLNLLINAIQASPNECDVTLSIVQEASFCVVQVIDHGTGISEENLKKIFSPFFTTKHEGNGFGLSQVHKVVRAHGGTIDVHSRPGYTAFTIRIPF